MTDGASSANLRQEAKKSECIFSKASYRFANGCIIRVNANDAEKGGQIPSAGPGVASRVEDFLKSAIMSAKRPVPFHLIFYRDY